jgi:hypothetical protein
MGGVTTRNMYWNLDDWLTVLHRSITLVNFQLDAQNSYLFIYIIHLLKSSTCFEHCPAHFQEVYVVIVYMQPLVLRIKVKDVQKYNKLYIIASCCTIISTKFKFLSSSASSPVRHSHCPNLQTVLNIFLYKRPTGLEFSHKTSSASELISNAALFGRR